VVQAAQNTGDDVLDPGERSPETAMPPVWFPVHQRDDGSRRRYIVQIMIRPRMMD
jgi:hypothetical protein